MVLSFLKLTAYVKIPALRNTLAEKRLTKILKCFTISAAPCVWDGNTKIDRGVTRACDVVEMGELAYERADNSNECLVCVQPRSVLRDKYLLSYQ
jgi:hypothetical protein